MTKKNIIITGGLGYVGGRLSKYFADQGHQVYALSRNKTIDYPNIKVHTNEEVVHKSVLKNTSIDVFIHLAAANEVECSQNPLESNNVNINGTVKWLDWVKENKVKQFIYFSTVHVYARPLIGTFNEFSSCLPNHPYSITHKCAEDYVLWYKSEFNLNTKIVRLSNSFGYPAFPTANRWTLFINDICSQIAESLQFEIHSNILQHRDFISLTEVCSAVEKLIGYQPTSFSDTIFNISKGTSKILEDISKLTKEVAEDYLSHGVKMIFDETKSLVSKELVIENDRLKSIGWNTNDSNDREEIIKTIAYFKNNTSK